MIPWPGEFYRYRDRRVIYFVQVVALIPHRGVGFLVGIRTFHRQFARVLAVNPILFDQIFERIDPDL